MTLVTDPKEVDTTLLPSGQQRTYLILSDEERAKGFVRPVRRSYRHVGISGPTNETRDLTAEEREKWPDFAKYEIYPPGFNGSAKGRFWTPEELAAIGKGCGSITTMGAALAETYARQPNFYGGTFCSNCCRHFPVGRGGEFVWIEPDGSNGPRVGT